MMQSIKLQAHVGSDGILKLEVPVGMLNTDLEVLVVVQAVTPAPLPSPSAASSKPTPEELGWPPGFFEQTEGALADDPIERPSQGEYEVREELM
jgi:hypothetical protein